MNDSALLTIAIVSEVPSRQTTMIGLLGSVTFKAVLRAAMLGSFQVVILFNNMSATMNRSNTSGGCPSSSGIWNLNSSHENTVGDKGAIEENVHCRLEQVLLILEVGAQRLAFVLAAVAKASSI